MRLRFWKMHGAGNDFVLVNDWPQTFPLDDTAWLRGVCARRLGVGCDGVILLQPAASDDFTMRFVNPDGCEVEMCGNGARCAAKLAHRLGLAGEDMSIRTAAGPVRAAISGSLVRLGMTPPVEWHIEQCLDVAGRHIDYGFVNTGVPHVVVHIDSLETFDVAGLGAAIRYHDVFAPAGTNVNFVAALGPQSLAVRTYERGVEGETLACGTGIVASALVCARAGHVRPPVTVRTAGGDDLTVDFRLTGEGAAAVMLTGPAEFVFEGELDYDGRAAVDAEASE